MTPLRAVLVGAGRVGAGYADDPAMAKVFPYASHAQVLTNHSRYHFEAVVDPARGAREDVARRWGVPHAAANPGDLPAGVRPDVVVVATPPHERVSILQAFPEARGAMLEKPLGARIEEAVELASYCEKRGLATQVNLWRRADPAMRALASGGLRHAVGDVQGAFAVYGRGIHNNGVHLIDLVRMLLGEVADVASAGAPRVVEAAPIPGDVDVAFDLAMKSGAWVCARPLDFRHHREIALDIWGTEGRIAIQQEGLRITRYPRKDHRAMTGAREVATDEPREIAPGAPQAFHEMYTDLADAIDGRRSPCSPPGSALHAERIVADILSRTRGA